jgi:hypothetical protein
MITQIHNIMPNMMLEAFGFEFTEILKCLCIRMSSVFTYIFGPRFLSLHMLNLIVRIFDKHSISFRLLSVYALANDQYRHKTFCIFQSISVSFRIC